MSISPRDRLVVTIAAAVLVVAALIAALLYPQFKQLNSLNAQVVEAQAQADAARLQLEERRGFKDRAIETNAKWLRLMNQVPDTPDLPSLIIELQDAAFASGVQMVSVQPATVVPGFEYSTIPVSVEIFGTWADTIDYLQSMPKLDRGLRLSSVSSKTLNSSGELNRRNSKLPAYAVDTVINLEAYQIPSATSTATVPAQ